MKVNMPAQSVEPWQPVVSSNRSASAQPGSADLHKLRKAAAEFEGMLLAKWWSSMRESGLPGGEDESDPGHDALDQLGMQAIASAMAAGRGIGIGAMLARAVLSNVQGAKPAGIDSASDGAGN